MLDFRAKLELKVIDITKAAFGGSFVVRAVTEKKSSSVIVN